MHGNLGARRRAPHQQTVGELKRTAQPEVSGSVAEFPFVLDVEEEIRLNAATPIVVLIIECGDRPKPVDHAIEHVDAEIDERAASSLGAVKVKTRSAAPIECAPILEVVTLNGPEQSFFNHKLQQKMACRKTAIHADGEHQLLFFRKLSADARFRRGDRERLLTEDMQSRAQAVHIARNMQMVRKCVNHRIYLIEDFAVVRHRFAGEVATLDKSVCARQICIDQRYKFNARMRTDCGYVFTAGDRAAA